MAYTNDIDQLVAVRSHPAESETTMAPALDLFCLIFMRKADQKFKLEYESGKTGLCF